MNRFVQAISIALLIVLSGCEVRRIDDSMHRVDQTARRANALANSLRNKTPTQRDSVVFKEEQWVSTKPIPTKRGLPHEISDCPVAYNEMKSLQAFAEWVSVTCKVPVRIMPDALDKGASYMRSNNQSGQAQARPAPIQPPAGASIEDLFPSGRGGATTSSYSGSFNSPMSVSTQYEGSLSGLLDAVTGSLGLFWRYDSEHGFIKIYYLETRHFNVYSFNKKTGFNSIVKSGMTSSAGVSSGTGGSNGGGNSSSGVSGDSGSMQSTTVDIGSSVVDDIESNVRSMLTLGIMSYSKTTGVMSITDRPDVLDRVGNYLDIENESITKQVLFNVEVISVKLSNKDQIGIDWNLVYKSVSGTWGFGLNNAFSAIDSSAIGSSISILDTSTSPWAGSKALVQALSQQGKVSARRSPSVTTLNLQAAPVQVGRVQSFLQSSQTTNSANVGSSTALTPGTITSGFNMSLLPFVMPDNQLLLQLAINMSSDPTFKTITSGDSSIQTPDYGLQIFNQSVKLRSGQTLVLSGFDQTLEDSTKTGVGSATNFLFGGGATSDRSRDVIVLVITPVILE